MTTATFKYIDPTSYHSKPWAKVDGPGTSFTLIDHQRPVHNIRGSESSFSTDNAGFAIYTEPSLETHDFTDESTIKTTYYSEISSILLRRLPGATKVVIFDHTIRRHNKTSPRQPVQQVHVDQTPSAAVVRVHRHLPSHEAATLLRGRYQIINVWRPISHPASDFPLAVVDWRSTHPDDFVPVDLMYPIAEGQSGWIDLRGKEKLPDEQSYMSTEGYEIKGETLAVKPSDAHRFNYAKDMTPDEVMFLKCFDSYGEGMEHGRKGVALRTPHTAFVDPNTPKDVQGRQSIEVRCLVFYE